MTMTMDDVDDDNDDDDDDRPGLAGVAGVALVLHVVTCSRSEQQSRTIAMYGWLPATATV